MLRYNGKNISTIIETERSEPRYATRNAAFYANWSKNATVDILINTGPCFMEFMVKVYNAVIWKYVGW